MKVELLMPQMGESISEATVARWKKQVGDFVEKDETILEISTDKVDSEVPAPVSGVLVEIKAEEGAVVAVKNVIAVIDSAAKGTKTAEKKEPKAKEDLKLVQPVAEAAKAKEVVSEVTVVSKSSGHHSPLVLQLAEKHGVSESELNKIHGSGVGARVTKEDLLNFVELRKNPKVQATVSEKPSKDSPVASVGRNIDFGTSETKIIPMDAMRRAIAEHMVRSKHTSPHVYTIQECDVSRISKWRAKNKDVFKKKEGFNLSFTPFFLEAAVRALLKFPYVNSSVDGDKVILKKHVNLGCAVAIGDAEKGFGLIVPVIRHSEEKNFVGLARSLNDLALKARNKKLVPDEVAGGTFTITNPGIFGTIIGTPIINQPQAAILCLGAIRKIPVVLDDDAIGIRERCFITLSYDHRVIDGSLSGSFLAEIRNFIENWDMDQTL
jgi:2-oxoglutarate dehydrogenase complex dihydrolipoamide succinyltransferase (E2) component